MLYAELSAAAQAAFAGLNVAAQDAEMQRSVADLPGGFVAKRINERSYWYYQRKGPDSKPQQFFVGPDDAATRDLMQRHYLTRIDRLFNVQTNRDSLVTRSFS